MRTHGCTSRQQEPIPPLSSLGLTHAYNSQTKIPLSTTRPPGAQLTSDRPEHTRCRLQAERTQQQVKATLALLRLQNKNTNVTNITGTIS